MYAVKIAFEREQSQVNMAFIEWATHMLQIIYTKSCKYVNMSKTLNTVLVRIAP